MSTTSPRPFVSLRGGSARTITIASSSHRCGLERAATVTLRKDAAMPKRTRTLKDLDRSSLTLQQDILPQNKRDDRASLLRTHLAKPKISAKQLQQLLWWINSLKAWPEEITLDRFPSQMQNGVLLCYILHALVPDFSLIKVNPKAKSLRAAQLNLEAMLQCLSRFSICTRNLPTAEAMWAGDRSALAVFVLELFQKVAVKRIPVQAIRSWTQGILRLYGHACEESTSWDAMDATTLGLWHAFRNGVRLWCVLHYYGYDNSPARERLFRPSDVHGHPTKPHECLLNATIVCSVIKHFGIPLVWDGAGLATHQGHEFVLVQLHHLYECLHDKVTPLSFSADQPVYLVQGENNSVTIHGLHLADSCGDACADHNDVDVCPRVEESLPVGSAALHPGASDPPVSPRSTESDTINEAAAPSAPGANVFAWEEYARLKRAIATAESSRMDDEEAWGISKLNQR